MKKNKNTSKFIYLKIHLSLFSCFFNGDQIPYLESGLDLPPGLLVLIGEVSLAPAFTIVF